MFSFYIQLLDWIKFGVPSIFVLYYIFTWVHWLIRAIPSIFFKPNVDKYSSNLKTSVIIPVVDEEPVVFARVIKSIVEEKPDQIIVVINGPRNIELEKICKDYQVKYDWIEKSGKRKAIDRGISLTNNAIIVLVDSDTIWTGNTLKYLVNEFSNNDVGGTTAKQRVLNNLSIIGWFADVGERLRNSLTFKSMSVFGQVGCLPGRTFAMRREIYTNYQDKFLNEKFFGVFKEYSDDRTLTNYILKSGYKTTYAYSSLVYTFAPKTWKQYYKQQLRWARGGQYNNLRMFWFYVTHKLYLGYMFTVDMLIPMLYVSVVINFLINLTKSDNYKPSVFDYSNVSLLVTFIIIGAIISTGLRLILVMEKFSDWLKIPLYLIISGFFITPIRLYGFATMLANSNWETRKNGYSRAENFNLIKFVPLLILTTIILSLVTIFQYTHTGI